MEVQSEFTIIGGGVAGLTAAIALKNLNCEFHLFEQAKELKGIGAGFGLAANAMQALDYMGLRNEIENIGYYLDSFAILDKNGEILVNPNTKQRMLIPPKMTVNFKPNTSLKLKVKN